MTNSGRNNGADLERRFAKWLCELNYFDRVEVRQRVRGNVSVEVYEVDVVAEREVKRWWRVCRVCAGFFWAGIPSFFLWLYLFAPISFVAMAWALGSLLANAILFSIAHSRKTIRVWAECKDTKDSVGREAVAILKHHVDDVQSKERGWRPTIVYLVTSGRFDQNAIRLANAYGFVCLQECEGGFQQAMPPLT